MLDLVRKLRRLLSRREKLQALLLMAAMMIGALLEMVGVGAIPGFVALLVQAEGDQSVPVIGDALSSLNMEQKELILWAAGALLVFFLIKNIYLAIVTWARARYTFNRQVGISRRLFATYLYSPYTLHLQRNSAELLRNINADAMQTVQNGLLPLLQLFMESVTIAGILILLLVVEPVTSLGAFVMLGGTAFILLRVVRSRMIRLGEKERGHRQGMVQSIHEGLGSIKVTRVLGREQHFLQSYSSSAHGFAAAGRIRQLMQELPRFVLETVAVAGLLALASILLAQGRTISSLLPTMTLLAVAVVRMIPSLNRLVSSLNSLRFGTAAITGVFDDLLQLERESGVEQETLALRDRIELENVNFTYPGAAQPSLQNVSLFVEAGTAVGIIGPTGAGKTTLVDVILGLLVPQDGELRVDGKAVAGRESAWQRNIGYVPQDVYLSDASIRENVAFGIPKSEIDEDAVRQAVEAAHASEFIDKLPEGLDTFVGERGVRVSGGQKQRLGIARALYHNPAVLILDEATSALDNETEKYVMEAIQFLRGSRTIILIAHRLTTVQGCDKLIKLNQGSISDCDGTISPQPLSNAENEGT